MIGKKGPFPEKDSKAGKEADEGGVGFIKNSQAVGAGHEGDGLGPFDWPNDESGEGLGSPAPAGQKHWLNE